MHLGALTGLGLLLLLCITPLRAQVGSRVVCPTIDAPSDTSTFRAFWREVPDAANGPFTVRVWATDGTDTVPLEGSLVAVEPITSSTANLAATRRPTDARGVARMPRGGTDSLLLHVRGFALHALRARLPAAARLDSVRVLLRVNPVAVCAYRLIQPASG